MAGSKRCIHLTSDYISDEEGAKGAIAVSPFQFSLNLEFWLSSSMMNMSVGKHLGNHFLNADLNA